MSVFQEEIIAATQAAVTSGRFNTIGTLSIMADEMSSKSETIVLQQTRDGVNWTPVMLNGVTQALTRKHNQLTISGPGLYRLVKSVTVNPIGVTLWRTEAK